MVFCVSDPIHCHQRNQFCNDKFNQINGTFLNNLLYFQILCYFVLHVRQSFRILRKLWWFLQVKLLMMSLWHLPQQTPYTRQTNKHSRPGRKVAARNPAWMMPESGFCHSKLTVGKEFPKSGMVRDENCTLTSDILFLLETVVGGGFIWSRWGL